jgi:hypothetical protein
VKADDTQALDTFAKHVGAEQKARALIEAAIEKDDAGHRVPFQPSVMTTAPDGSVSVAMPDSVRVGPGPGDVVALYDARPNPVAEKAALLIKFDTMLANAAASLDKSLPNLIKLAQESITGVRTLTKEEVDGLLAVIDGIQAANENINNMMAYRNALAQELKAIQGGAKVSAPTVDGLLESLLARVNDLGNDYNYHSGWNPSAVLYHAVTIGKDEAADFVKAMQATSVPLVKRQNVLQLFYKNAGDGFSPLILGKDGAKALTDYAQSVGLPNLDFSKVADHPKSHPLG